MTKVLCFGDSITLGENDEARGGWVDRLKTDFIQQYVNASYHETTVYNLGIAGETTDGLAQRFQTEVNARHRKRDKTLVIFAYGINDVVIKKQKHTVPLIYFQRNIEQCIHYAHSLNIEVLLLSALPVAHQIDGRVNRYNQLIFNRDIVIFNQLLKNMATQCQCHYLDLFSIFLQKENSLSPDGIHPNSVGHTLLTEKIKNKLIQINII